MSSSRSRRERTWIMAPSNPLDRRRLRRDTDWRVPIAEFLPPVVADFGRADRFSSRPRLRTRAEHCPRRPTRDQARPKPLRRGARCAGDSVPFRVPD